MEDVDFKVLSLKSKDILVIRLKGDDVDATMVQGIYTKMQGLVDKLHGENTVKVVAFTDGVAFDVIRAE